MTTFRAKSPTIRLPWRPESGGGPSVNLLPMLNVFLALVPFLLLCAAFAPLSAATISRPQDLIPAHGKAVSILLHIKPTMFVIEAEHAGGTEGSIPSLSTTVPRVLDDGAASVNTTAQLIERLYRIKRGYPDSDTVVLLPDDTIAYEDVVGTMDAVRQIGEKRRGARRIPLFASIVLGSTGL
jgi:biopolymer transport protein ExbD